MALKLFRFDVAEKVPGCTETIFEIMNSVISEVNMERYFSPASLHSIQIKAADQEHQLIYEEIFQVWFCKNVLLQVVGEGIVCWVCFVLFNWASEMLSGLSGKSPSL